MSKIETAVYYIHLGKQFDYLNKEWLLDVPIESYEYWDKYDSERIMLEILEPAVKKIKEVFDEMLAEEQREEEDA